MQQSRSASGSRMLQILLIVDEQSYSSTLSEHSRTANAMAISCLVQILTLSYAVATIHRDYFSAVTLGVRMTLPRGSPRRRNPECRANTLAFSPFIPSLRKGRPPCLIAFAT